MKTSRYTEAQILAILRQAEGGMSVAELCHRHGMMPLPGNGLLSNLERERVVLQLAGEVWRHALSVNALHSCRGNRCVADQPDEGDGR